MQSINSFTSTIILNNINYSVYVFQVDKMSDNVKQYSCNGSGCRKSFMTISGRLKHSKKCTFPVTNLKLYEKR